MVISGMCRDRGSDISYLLGNASERLKLRLIAYGLHLRSQLFLPIKLPIPL